ncbi:hypothetical protein N7512_005180 [Penicillium capsulatum]|nr:hypothetical protein N7512_005180 [Penicillium capsulatum]
MQKREAPPSAGKDGICFTHVLLAQQSCQSLAQQYSLTVQDIENYNAQSWGWHGCGQVQEGASICLSPGDPPMPVALGQAICGPQVPGTARPSKYSELSSLNPCPSGQCCSLSGLCGTTPDFCLAKNCISNCGEKHNVPGTAKPVSPAPATDHVPAEVPSAESTKESTKKTAEAERETMTKTQKEIATKAAEKPQPTESWIITIYSQKGCKGDYYILQGYNHNNDGSHECIDIAANANTDLLSSSASCQLWKNEGLSWIKCRESPFKEPKSWFISNGYCTAYSDRKCKSQAGRIYGPWIGCQDGHTISWTPKTYKSLVCGI